MRLDNFKTDFSCFFRRKNKVVIPNTVKLVVGTDIFDCSGCILAQHSPVFLELILKQDEVYLDEFVGCLNSVQDCVELLYGGDIPISIGNIQALFKFSMMYKIDGVFGLCLQWANEQLSMTNFFTFCKMGLFIKSVDIEHEDVLNSCKEMILKCTADDLLQVSKTWPDDTNVMNILFDKQLLRLTLPTITNWMDSEKKVIVALDNIEELQLQGTLSKHCSQSLEMTAKMNEICETVPNLKRVNKLQACLAEGKLLLEISVAQTDSMGRLFLKSCEHKQWRNLDVDQLSSLHSHYKLEDFFYAEIILDWICFTKPLQEAVDKIWGTVRQENINHEYISVLRNSIITLDSKYVLPVLGDDVVYKYPGRYHSNDFIHSEFIKAKLTIFVDRSVVMMNKPCDVKDCTLETGWLVTFKLTDTTDTIPCYQLGVEDKSNGSWHCHHDRIKHWYATEEMNGQRVMLSFVTNNMTEVIDKVKGSTNVHLHFLYLK